jgi:NADPH:quinone reductase
MRAIIARELGPPENLVIEEIAPLSAGPGQVVVDNKAAAVNFPDLLVMEGKYQFRPPLPFSPGKEGAGIIKSVGEGVTGLKPGDRVMVQVEYGAYAQEVLADESQCYPVPDGVSFEEAAAIGIAYQTAHFALVARAHVKKGDRVLVTGASGSVGLAAMQLAAAWGCEVIAGLTTMSKEDLARENGAHHVIDISGDNLKDSIREDIKAITGGGVDIVIEIVGGDVFDGAIRALDFGGSIVVVGFTSGTIPSMKVNYTLLKNIAVTGVNWAEYRDRDPAWVQKVQTEIFEMVSAGQLKVPVQAVFPMDRIVEACKVLSDRKVRGKIVIDTGAEGAGSGGRWLARRRPLRYDAVVFRAGAFRSGGHLVAEIYETGNFIAGFRADSGLHVGIVCIPFRQPLRGIAHRLGRNQHRLAGSAGGKNLFPFRNLVTFVHPRQYGDDDGCAGQAFLLDFDLFLDRIGVFPAVGRGNHVADFFACIAADDNETPGRQAAMIGYPHAGRENFLQVRIVRAGAVHHLRDRRAARHQEVDSLFVSNV